ncbi:MAG: preprotein translocase subunit SecE [Parcubacteria group bacterium]|nr:preprotein translocase subunit SecE [Parcubacteria group bacterium]
MALINKIRIFFREVWTESRKVDWPTRQATLRYTVIVVVISLAVAAFLGLLDFVFFKALSLFVV